MTRPSQTTILLEKSIQFEEMRKHLLLMLDQLDVLMSEHPEMTSVDFAEEFVAAAKFATRNLGRKYSTTGVEQWIENQNPH